MKLILPGASGFLGVNLLKRIVNNKKILDTCAAFRGSGRNSLKLIESVPFPHSVGLFAAYITQYLGFRSNPDEYKVMGLSSYGKPRYDLTKLMASKDGNPVLNTATHPW